MKKNVLKILTAILIIIAPIAMIKAFWFEKRQLNFENEKQIVLDDDGHYFVVNSKASTVGGFLKENEISLGKKDLIFPNRDSELSPKMNIEIRRSIKAKIYVDGEELEVNTLKKNIKGAVEDAGVTLSHLDIVKPGKDSMLYEGTEIEITRIEIEEVIEKEKIEFETIEKEDDDLKWRKKKIVQEGKNGSKEVEYRIKYKNGKIVEKTKLNSKIVEESIPEIVAVGTKVEVGKTKTGLASWYSHVGGMFCASRMFARGTWLRVTNRGNGKQVFVQVNDYGPMRGTGKMIDLDKPAFDAIANLGQGVVEVKVEEILE